MSDGAVLTPLATPIALEAGQPPELPGPARSRPADPRQAPNSHCALMRRRQPTPLTSSKPTKSRVSGLRSDTRAQPATFKSP